MKKQDIFKKISECKNVDDVLVLANELNEPITKEQAKIVFDYTSNHKGEEKLTDGDLDNVSGGWKLPWQDDDNPPAPKFVIGDLVIIIISGVTRLGHIQEVSTERESFWGFNPEWRYGIKADFNNKVYYCYESEIGKRS